MPRGRMLRDGPLSLPPPNHGSLVGQCSAQDDLDTERCIYMTGRNVGVHARHALLGAGTIPLLDQASQEPDVGSERSQKNRWKPQGPLVRVWQVPPGRSRWQKAKPSCQLPWSQLVSQRTSRASCRGWKGALTWLWSSAHTSHASWALPQRSLPTSSMAGSPG